MDYKLLRLEYFKHLGFMMHHTNFRIFVSCAVRLGAYQF